MSEKKPSTFLREALNKLEKRGLSLADCPSNREATDWQVVAAETNLEALELVALKTYKEQQQPQQQQQPQPQQQPLPKIINTDELWQSILRITSDVEGDLATALVFDVFQDDTGAFLYLLANEHYHLIDGNTYSIQYCNNDNVFIEVDTFERDEFQVWKSSQENDYVIYKLALSSDIWEVGAGIANRKPGPSSKRPRRGQQQQPAPMASVICKTPSFWFEGVHPGDEMCVYALPGSIPGRWLSHTSITNVGHSMFFLQALSAPGGSGGAVIATTSGKMAGFIGGAYDVKEPESTNPKKLADRRFNTYAFSVHALPRRLSSPPSSPA